MRMFRRANPQSDQAWWRNGKHGRAIARRAGLLFWAVVLYLMGSLIIWGLHMALRPAGMEFLSSIIGMALVFAIMEIAGKIRLETNSFYEERIKPKVDFINKNMGIGFPVPLTAIGDDDALGPEGIGRVIANFVTTNAIFWILFFILAIGVVVGIARIPVPYHRAAREKVNTNESNQQRSREPENHDPPRLELQLLAPTHSRRASSTTTLQNPAPGYQTGKEAVTGPGSRSVSAYFTDSECPTPMPQHQQRPLASEEPRESTRNSSTSVGNDILGCPWSQAATISMPILIPALFVVVVGIPVSHVTGDERLLDGFMLWLTWIASWQSQSALSAHLESSQISSSARQTTPLLSPNFTSALPALLNPVLLTTLAMTAYIRARSAATSTPLADIVSHFSSGVSLSTLWSYKVSPERYPLPIIHEPILTADTLDPNPAPHFGAGDAALSLLETGIVIWGFKLHECRRQLTSRAGLGVVLVSAAAAALNVFIASLLGKAVGLDGPEALAFAARSVTLALARPAVGSLGGNQVVNAALVVSNGILGQVMYPFVLGRLAPGGFLTQRSDGEALWEETSGSGQVQGTPREAREAIPDETGERRGDMGRGSQPGTRHWTSRQGNDDARTIAAGTSIGINGAAMGVAYLYERKHRAAPYAALSMTVFGVMTVVFTAVEPFTSTLIKLTS